MKKKIICFLLALSMSCSSFNCSFAVAEDIQKDEIESDVLEETAVEPMVDVRFDAQSNKTIVTAPAGYLIGAGGNPDGEFYKEMVLEGEQSMVRYYLKNMDDDTVTPEKTCILKAPVITSSEITKTDENQILKFLTFGVVTNSSTKITVQATGYDFIDENVRIVLLNKNEELGVKEAVAEKVFEDSETYCYKAEFELDYDESEELNLSAYAVSGSVPESLNNRSEVVDMEFNENAIDKNVLIFDKVRPAVAEFEHDEYKNNVRIKIVDEGSGINSINIICNENTIFSKNFDEKCNEYFADIEIPDGENMITIYVTDNAGNYIPNGCQLNLNADTTPPTVQYQRKQNTWYKAGENKVWFTIEETNSGINTISYFDNGKDISEKVESDGEAQYINISDFEHGEHSIRIEAVDNAGNVMPDNHFNFKVDFEAPEIVLPKEKWYGSNDQQLEITAEDLSKDYIDEIVVVVDDQEDMIYTSVNSTNKYRLPINISQFSEGEHNFKITAKDKAGNSSSTEYTFNIDRNEPKGEFIPPVAVDSDGKTVEAKPLNEYLWFNKDNIITLEINGIEDENLEKVYIIINGNKTLSFDKIKDGKISLVLNDDSYFNNYNRCRVEALIQDKAGNIHKISQSVYRDKGNPVINSVIVSKEQSAADKILSVLSFGTYSNEKIFVTTDVRDNNENDSGISKVEIKYGDSNTYLMTDMGGGKYTFEIPFDNSIMNNMIDGNIEIIAYDMLGNTSEQGWKISDGVNDTDSRYFMIENQVSDIGITFRGQDIKNNTPATAPWFNQESNINELGSNNVFLINVKDEKSGLKRVQIQVNSNDDNFNLERTYNQTKIETDSYNLKRIFGGRGLKNGLYSITVTVEDNSGNISSGTAYINVDLDTPVITLTTPEFSKDDYWYGKDKINEEIIFSIEDNDIKEVIVKDGDVEIYKGNDKSHSFPLKNFDKGKEHQLFISVTDIAGNTITEETPEFQVDFKEPEGKVYLINTTDDNLPNPVMIDGKPWFNGGDGIIYGLDIDDDNPDCVSWEIKYSGNDQKTNGRFEFDEGNHASLNLSDTGAALNEEADHGYYLTAVFYDKAGNKCAKTFDVYRDLKDPTIESAMVEKYETAADKILRVLTFGIYSNDKVKIRVKASDHQYDSGLDDKSAEISLHFVENVENEYVPMEYVDGEYCCILELNESYNISIRITDRYGHYSYVKKLEGADSFIEFENSVHIITENTPPEVTVTMPGRDYPNYPNDPNYPIVISEEDKVLSPEIMLWYRDDKNIEISLNDKVSGINNVRVTVNGTEIGCNEKNECFNKESFSKLIDNNLHKYTISTNYIKNYLASSGDAPEDGCYMLVVTAEDNSGNKTEVKKAFWIDDKKPAVKNFKFSIPASNDASSVDYFRDITKSIEILDYGFYFKEAVTFNITMSDEAPTSGLYKAWYNLAEYNDNVKIKDNYHEAKIENGQIQFDVPANFKGQIFVQCYDYAGNFSGIITPDSFIVDTPQKHETEEHIIIEGLGETEYADNDNLLLYATNVDMSVTISDTMSGIREVSYDMTSELEKIDRQVIILENSNANYSVGSDVGNGWIITRMDKNLVTELKKTFSYSKDNNSIHFNFAMVDRANNITQKDSPSFSIDQTAPVINVEFNSPDGNNEYYRENRTAKITVTERNFDPKRIVETITNENGSIPSLVFKSISNTEHVAEVTFSEGDYTFEIAGTDLCGHNAEVKYSGGNERRFFVDKTNPEVSNNFDILKNDKKNTFNTDKEFTLTLNEHNFDESLVKFTVYRTKAGQELTSANRENCTSEYISGSKWKHENDIHQIVFVFKDDYVYQVYVSVYDKSGRFISEIQSPVFEIDKTKPELSKPKNFEVLSYVDSEKSEPDPIIFTDANISRVHYKVVSYQMKLNDDGIGCDMDIDTKEFDAEAGKVVISDEYFSQDGIYEVNCTAYDRAGNASDVSTHTYVIQRNSDFLVYIPNSSKENHTGLYRFDKVGIRSDNFEDIEIVSYVQNNKNLEIHVDGKRVADNDLLEIKNDTIINKITAYRIILKGKYISNHFGGDSVETDLTLNAVARSIDSEKVITLGHIYIDNVKPTGEYEQSLKSKTSFWDGFYGVENQTVKIEGVSRDIDLNQCEIQLNDDVHLTYSNGGFNYDADKNEISFVLSKGYTDIRPTLVDNAGNVNNLEIMKNVYVGSRFSKFWYIYVAGGAGVVSVVSFVIFIILKNKKRRRP